MLLKFASFQEKWDSMTRRWKDNCLLQQVKLFLIDEVIAFFTAHFFAHLFTAQFLNT